MQNSVAEWPQNKSWESPSSYPYDRCVMCDRGIKNMKFSTCQFYDYCKARFCWKCHFHFYICRNCKDRFSRSSPKKGQKKDYFLEKN
jgi:hypothetical protein